MKLSERWADKANKYGLHSKDKRLALLCLDAVHDIAQLEAKLEPTLCLECERSMLECACDE